MKIVAIIAVRNSEMYVRSCIEYLLANDIMVILIENGSTDNTLREINQFELTHLVEVISEPYMGEYNLERLLSLKEEVRRSIDADWIIAQDIDEILQSEFSHETLYDSISRIANEGFTVINFNEFVFIPENETVSYIGRDYYSEMKSYYHFAPSKLRLMRAYKNDPNFSQVNSGGHRISSSNTNLYPTDLVHRHYVALSMEYLRNKYANRVFSKTEVARGWHKNRINIDWDLIKAPELNQLKKLELDMRELDDSDPKSCHFWQW